MTAILERIVRTTLLRNISPDSEVLCLVYDRLLNPHLNRTAVVAEEIIDVALEEGIIECQEQGDRILDRLGSAALIGYNSWTKIITFADKGVKEYREICSRGSYPLAALKQVV
ncbi:MAG: hypothetical protein QW331_02650 [Candidatus Woesearchaeota archaeon]